LVKELNDRHFKPAHYINWWYFTQYYRMVRNQIAHNPGKMFYDITFDVDENHNPIMLEGEDNTITEFTLEEGIDKCLNELESLRRTIDRSLTNYYQKENF
jgi:hypothetical protein